MKKIYRFSFLKLTLLLILSQTYTSQTYTQAMILQKKSKETKARGLSINSPYNDYMPFISPDGHHLLFQSDRPDGSIHSGDSDLWISHRDTKFIDRVVFLPPEHIGMPINTQFLEGMGSIWFESKNQWHLYFTSILSRERKNGVGETDIFHSIYKDGIFSNPSPLEEINTLFHDRMPYIVSDGSVLFFTSNRPGGYGGDDIWISEYDGEKEIWKKPYNAGSNINTKYDETSPAIHKNKISLYFASNRIEGYGGFDIYRSQKKELPQGSVWTKPKNLGNKYNSRYDEEGVSLSGDGEYIYFSSNQTQGKGLFDLYEHKLRFEFRAQLPVIFTGNIYIQGTKKGIEANIKISNRGLEHNLASNLPRGDFSIQLQSNDLYHIQVSAPGYEAQQYKLNLRDIIQQNKRKRKVFFLKKVNRRMMTDQHLKMMSKNDKIQKNKMMMSKKLKGKEDKMMMSKNDKMQKNKMMMPPVLTKRMKKPKKQLATFYFPVKLATIGKINSKIWNRQSTKNTDDTASSPEPSNLQKIRDQIKKIYSSWKKQKTMQVLIEGHSGKEGSSKEQEEVSRKRSLFIRSQLLKIGIPKERLIHHWHGFTRPVSVEVDADSRAKNRRVEVFIY